MPATTEATISRAGGSGSRLEAVASQGARAQWAAEVKDYVKDIYDEGRFATDLPDLNNSELPTAVQQRASEAGNKYGSSADVHLVDKDGGKAYAVIIDTDDDRKTHIELFDANGKSLASGLDTTGKLEWAK
jgi:hypothetical protein